MLALKVVSLLLPHLFRPQSDCDIVLPDCMARVYEANADIQHPVKEIAPTRSWSRALTLVKHGDDAGPRKCKFPSVTVSGTTLTSRPTTAAFAPAGRQQTDGVRASETCVGRAVSRPIVSAPTTRSAC